ncbi:carbonic anhydrase [Helicobacter mustelae]|uniref:Carbonic anhydrase n=1 Tax=Helicobacter mustelae (strain ATCC 43772 / CCUG 25715 / CIP 103759 / LMG 18044 / NCTC 12198 / R85-136P) TaxID=679897 RepID=D3UG02_HELM1|nr:carbonic anhydrase [Helicobacter mustelae]CBG39423.1 carbonic anyhydrase [Helicobacter mustelae 12198]SQH70935.1 carbonic anyhydrase [Helicobacter mustelae]STP12061.1 carbonic anyhydrase [Helicobacter mustelae]
MKELFDGAVKFQEDDFMQYKELYKSLEKHQDPHTLFLTCVDSRVVPNLITNTLPGDLFVIRNMGNIVPPYHEGSHRREGYLSTTSAIEYALNVLDIKNIIICGHSDCGACAAIYEGEEMLKRAPYVKKWVELLEPVKKKVLAFHPKSRIKRMWLTEQINIEQQLENLMTYPFVEEKFDRGELRIYGWYYMIATGEIFNYNMITREFKAINKEKK